MIQGNHLISDDKCFTWQLPLNDYVLNPRKASLYVENVRFL